MKTFFMTILFTGLLATPALAHHPLGGEVPQTLMHGLLSGIGHPIIGFDHLAFILAIGVLAAMGVSSNWGRRIALPLGFIGGTLFGAVLLLGGVAMPMVEIGITLSVIGVGFLAMQGRNLALVPSVSLAAIAGLFHGSAYGAAVIGAEPTPILAYLAGFGLTQAGLALGAMAFILWLKRGDNGGLVPRFAGAMVMGIGLTYMVEIAESAILPTL